ncbi:MAG: histidinol-phosphate transaminase [Gammaproteobacteria bacterium]
MKKPVAPLVESLIRAELRALAAYHVPDSRNMIKLDAMENPYGWPELLISAWLERLRDVNINRYPDPAPHALKEQLRLSMGIPRDAALLLGNGSDELIQMIALALAAPGRAVLAPEPGFVMYRMIATIAAMDYVGVPLMPDFNLDLPAMLAAIMRHQPAVVFLAYPNNPTGNLFDAQAMHAVIAASPGLVVVDEAYHVFAGQSFMAELAHYPNLLVMRTVSKMGLAGLRLGVLAGHPDWLNEIDKIRLPYNINVLTQASMEFALQYREIFAAQAQQICADRDYVFKQLHTCPGIIAYPSNANFILFRVPHGRATSIFEALKGAGVLIKNMHNAGGLLQDCLRVTVGKPAENEAFLAALKNAL